jgi:hypothetical protein
MAGKWEEDMNLPAIRKKRVKPSYQKPEAVKELEALVDAEALRLHPTCPALTPRTFRDDTANSLTGCITTYLRLKGAFVSRLNNTGIYDKRLNKYRPGTSRKGLPDVVCTFRSKSLFIEVKHGSDKLSEYQEKIRDEQIRSGGLWFTAHDFTEVKEWIDRL